MYSHLPSVATPISPMVFFFPSWVLKKNDISLYHLLIAEMENFEIPTQALTAPCSASELHFLVISWIKLPFKVLAPHLYTVSWRIKINCSLVDSLICGEGGTWTPRVVRHSIYSAARYQLRFISPSYQIFICIKTLSIFIWFDS